MRVLGAPSRPPGWCQDSNGVHKGAAPGRQGTNSGSTSSATTCSRTSEWPSLSLSPRATLRGEPDDRATCGAPGRSPGMGARPTFSVRGARGQRRPARCPPQVLSNAPADTKIAWRVTACTRLGAGFGHDLSWAPGPVPTLCNPHALASAPVLWGLDGGPGAC